MVTFSFVVKHAGFCANCTNIYTLRFKKYLQDIPRNWIWIALLRDSYSFRLYTLAVCSAHVQFSNIHLMRKVGTHTCLHMTFNVALSFQFPPFSRRTVFVSTWLIPTIFSFFYKTKTKTKTKRTFFWTQPRSTLVNNEPWYQ